MYRFLPTYVIAAVLFVIGLQGAAQTSTGTITGHVQDTGGAVLVSAKVSIDPSGRQVPTDNQGSFRFANLAAGQYTLTASYVGFKSFSSTVTVTAGQTADVTAALEVLSAQDSVMVTAPRLHGDAEAVNVERMSSQIVQVEPAGVINSLPNNNIADAVGRLPSVSLERDEGEGKYVQIRGTEPRLSNVTINGINVPAPEVIVRQIKLDAVPANVVERIEVFKTLSADQDADAIGGTVNLVTKTAQEKPTYELGGTAGYNPLQNGYWRGGFDGTFGQRFGINKQFGFLLGGAWDRTNRGIDDLEPSQTFGTLPNGQNVAYINSEDMRSYQYYRTRYGFDIGTDYKITPTATAYFKGLYSDFHDYGEAEVYTPNAGALTGFNGKEAVFDNTGNWQYRHYIRRPDQQVYSFQTGVRHQLKSNVINYEFAVSRGHNIGGQAFPTTYFQGPENVPFVDDQTNPLRPKLIATDQTNGFDPTQYGVTETDGYTYHATQLNYEGNASLAHDYTVAGHPSTFSLGLSTRNSYSTQRETNDRYNITGNSPFGLDAVQGSYTNPTYYDKTFAINGQAYGPTSSYNKILQAVASNASAFSLDTVNGITTAAQAFFNADERITAGYIQDVIFLGNFRLEAGVRFDNDATHFFANNVTANVDAQGNALAPTISANRQDASYFNVLPSVALQYQVEKNTNIRAVYGRGISRPNLGDLVPATTIDPNQTPYPTIATGNPALQPTKANNVDVLVEHFFQPLGIIQAGYFFKQLADPIYPTATLVPFNGRTYQQTEAINGPNAHIQGFEAQWEQRFSFLPGLLSGFGISANYSHTASRVDFPDNFDGGRTDHPTLDRTSPNDYNFNLTYDKSRFSGRFAISHNDPSIAAYQWDASTGPAGDPILGLKGPTGDNYFYSHTQFDVQGSYRVLKGIQIVASGLNLSNEVFGFYNGSTIYPVQREYYRPTVSFGIRWQTSSEQ
ncbi:TonB-dependent receptor [Silvibacterium acidisoli]|uniref:TonB-dependent receptor n=1 Tax=Acidobacteriaceae bacterium ZG23-2 TaxID=2883246 RepID=UPI00406C17F9